MNIRHDQYNKIVKIYMQHTTTFHLVLHCDADLAGAPCLQWGATAIAALLKACGLKFPVPPEVSAGESQRLLTSASSSAGSHCIPGVLFFGGIERGTVDWIASTSKDAKAAQMH